MTQDIVIIVKDGTKLTEAEATKQLQAQGLQFTPDAGTIITAIFDTNSSVLAEAMKAARHVGAMIKHNVFMVPASYALYLKDEKDKYGDIELKNHLEASAKTAVSSGVYIVGSALGDVIAGAALAPGFVATSTGIVAGCLVAATADMVTYDDPTLYEYLRNGFKDAIYSIKDVLHDASQLLDADKEIVHKTVDPVANGKFIVEEYYMHTGNNGKSTEPGSLVEPIGGE